MISWMNIHASDWLKHLILLFVIVLAAVLALDQFTPPDIVPASAPPTDFSAERAMEHLKIIAKEPRPLGSQANAAARDYLVDTLSSMGLHPEIQTTTAVQRWPGSDIFRLGTVHNVAVRLPGTASTRAILLNAHYDGGATGPAASDCGSCVVTLLETLRALQAGPPLENDIIFVFTDGEENNDIGAAAFAAEHPFMKDVGLAINFEALGSRGPAELYVTSQKNGWLMDQFFKAAPDPLVSSFFTDLMGLFPSLRPGTDLEEYMDRGKAGFAFLYAADTPAYHTMRDNVEVIDPRSIQHQGSYALSLVRHFGNMDMNVMPSEPNAVFFNVLRNAPVYYSGRWVIPLAAFVSLIFIAIVALGFYRKHLTVGGLISGVFAFTFSIIITMLLVILVWQAVRTFNINLQVFMTGRYNAELYLAVLIAFAIAVMALLYTLLLSRIRVYNLTVGALFLWIIFMILSSIFFPGASYLFTWPLFFSLLALGWMFLNEPSTRPWLHITTLSITAVSGILLIVPAMAYPLPSFMGYLEVLSGLPLASVPVLFIILLFGLFVPHLHMLSGETYRGESWRRLSVPVIAAFVSLLFIVLAAASSGFDAGHPRPNSVAYVLDADTNEAVWVSVDPGPDNWTSQFFPAGAEKNRTATLYLSGQSAFRAQAPVVPLSSPEVTALGDTSDSGVRTLLLQMTSSRGAVYTHIDIKTKGQIEYAEVDGKPLDLGKIPSEKRNRLNFFYYGLPKQGIELTLNISSTEPITIILEDFSSGLPAIPGMTIAPRPADTMATPGQILLDPTIVRKSLIL